MPTGGRSRRDTAIQSASKVRRAAAAACPKCGRKSALVRFLDDTFSGYYCRWVEQDKCDYRKLTER